MKRTVVIGLLGQVLDSPKRSGDRWDGWRPTVSICQHEDLLVDRLELLHTVQTAPLLSTLKQDIASVSPETELRPHLLMFRDEWDFEDVFSRLHAFARDYPFDLENEDYLVHITTGTHVAQICLFLLTESRHLPGRLLQTSPPRRARQGPGGQYRIIDLDLSRYDSLAARFAIEHTEGTSFLKSGIATRNADFNRLVDEIERVAIRSQAPVLLMGPTGSGKSQLARRIYELKRHRGQLSGPLVSVNCATIRGNGAMSALFGHRRGSFTGAVDDRPGLLRSADGGVLFLDEIGELGLEEQAMLLRAVEEKTFLPVGSDTEVRADFQLICGTNRDLYAESAVGRFRDDLLARINLWSWELPGLAQRPEDLEPNIDYELEQYAARYGQRLSFNREARERFLAFATAPGSTWPGNFRDLNAAIVRMATLASPQRIGTEQVDQEIHRLRRKWQASAADTVQIALTAAMPADEIDQLDRFDQVQLAEVIAVCRKSTSLSEAGRSLFAVSRTQKAAPNDADRLRKYLARFNLTFADLQKPTGKP